MTERPHLTVVQGLMTPAQGKHRRASLALVAPLLISAVVLSWAVIVGLVLLIAAVIP